MLKIKFITVLTLALIAAGSFRAVGQQKVDWNGYLQFRFSNNYLNDAEFSVRRAKFWVSGLMPGKDEHWSYKLQAAFQKKINYQFLLQDALINYTTGDFTITAGQFVTDFSLQRKQSDYTIPLVERALAVNSLVPGAETMGRDLGLQIKLNKSRTGSFSLGFFNGNGANNISKQKNFLYINRGSFYFLNNSISKLEIGYSLSFRSAHNLHFTKITGNNNSFTGKEFRFGIDENLTIGNFEIQSEYLESHLENRKAYGYYALVNYLVASKNLLTLSVERFNDLNPLTDDNPWYILGYAYKIKGDSLKVSLDNRFQFTSNKTNSLTTLQVQYFFN